MLYQHIAIDSDFIALFDIVRKEKSQKEICFSAKESQNILEILKEVINKDIYKKDYYFNTINLLKKPISYLETTITLNNIIERIEKQKNIYSKLY